MKFRPNGDTLVFIISAYNRKDGFSEVSHNGCALSSVTLDITVFLCSLLLLGNTVVKATAFVYHGELESFVERQQRVIYCIHSL